MGVNVRSELGGWSNLTGAEEDYKTLSTMTNLSSPDRKIVQTQLKILPPRTKAAQEKEMLWLQKEVVEQELGRNGIWRQYTSLLSQIAAGRV